MCQDFLNVQTEEDGIKKQNKTKNHNGLGDLKYKWYCILWYKISYDFISYDNLLTNIHIK